MRGLAALALCLAPAMGVAQGLSLGEPVSSGFVQSAVLVIDFERAFSESAFGARIGAELESEGQAIAAENRRIEAELVEEERSLTQRRPAMEAGAFRVLAEAFDEKVQRLRREQDEKARSLGARSEAARRQFAEAARPVLGTLMQQASAAVILELRAVFVAADAIDVTDEAIELIDGAIGDGSALTPAPEAVPESPAQPAPPETPASPAAPAAD
ncbi:OmpH family outer membrane protein [Thetidibacter halocola]|uniref:OmpH family outer membrane protein n=1 Tax=Thetidibacter halocola TaxID=2827239 RepID=A0A8J7WCT6_9RHOB|nr:OmpH family outer membrane protein [Thetidibacter halocola]MBS0122859.1 OmpH family outer membrane protein [Thetidibacter halocola]